MAPGPGDAAGTVDAQTAPTAPWKTLRVLHELPQGILSTKPSTDRLNYPQILLRNLFLFFAHLGIGIAGTLLLVGDGAYAPEQLDGKEAHARTES